jgi:4-hydroxybenzoate polyprenyltransferase
MALHWHRVTAQRAVIGGSDVASILVKQRRQRFRAAVRVLRPLHWTKNLLVFLPLFFSHQFLNPSLFEAALVGFVAFSACSSAVYVVNDLLDIDSDFRHPTKRNRPFASGDLPVSWAIPLASGLMGLGIITSLAVLPIAFTLLLLLYMLATGLYSIWLKRVVSLDVVILAALYTLRILAGGAATTITVSEWLMAFSMFFFLSLAFAKRYAELKRLATEKDDKDAALLGRGYLLTDLDLVETMGPTNGYLGVLVFSLYINSNGMRELYRYPSLLWLICPILLYWITRLWIKAGRGELLEDPVVFALTDTTSICLASLVVTLLLAASA